MLKKAQLTIQLIVSCRVLSKKLNTLPSLERQRTSYANSFPYRKGRQNPFGLWSSKSQGWPPSQDCYFHVIFLHGLFSLQKNYFNTMHTLQLNKLSLDLTSHCFFSPFPCVRLVRNLHIFFSGSQAAHLAEGQQKKTPIFKVTKQKMHYPLCCPIPKYRHISAQYK